MIKRALITGITGQDGAYLAQLLLQKGYDVYGLIRRISTPNTWRLDELGITNDVQLLEGDMTDIHSLNAAVKMSTPDEIYNLAAQSFVGISWQQPVLTNQINALGTLHLLNALLLHAPSAKYFQASSSEMFGNTATKMQDESTPFHPCSPYAISKVTAHWTTINYRESYDLFACSGICFNHESPLRGLEFVTRKISDAVARIHLGLSDHIALGNVDAARDWGHAKDYVQAMWLMLQQGKADEFVIATGKTHSVSDFLTAAFAVIGINDWKPYVQIDPQFLRPNDVETLCGNSQKAREKLGWEPSIDFEELCRLMVEADVKRLEKVKSDTVTV